MLDLRVLSNLGSVIGGANCKVQIGSKTCCYPDPENKGHFVICVNLNKEMTARDMLLVNGFIDHESAHVRYTIFDLVEVAISERGETGRKMLNIVEDIRIERMIGLRYPGAFVNLIQLTEELTVDESFWAFPVSSMPLISLVSCMFLYAGRAGILGQNALQTRAVAAYQLLVDRVGVLRAGQFRELLGEVATLADTTAAWVLTKRILDLLSEIEQSGEDNQPNLPEPKSNGKGGSAGGDAGDESDDDESDDSAGGNAGGKSDGDESDDSAGGNAGGKSDGDESDDATGGNAGGKFVWVDEDGEPVLAKDICDGVAKLIDDIANGNAPSRDPEESGPTTGGFNPFQGVAEVNVCTELAPGTKVVVAHPNDLITQTVHTAFNQWARGMVRCERTRRTSGSKVLGNKLHGVQLGNARVFEHIKRTIAPSAAIEVLLDGSGSMKYRAGKSTRYEQAATAALSVVEALQKTAHFYVSLSQFNVHIQRLLDWDQKSVSYLPEPQGGTNVSGALLVATAHILPREEDVKVVLILTDGNTVLGGSLDEALNSGVKVCCVRFGDANSPLDGLDISLQPFCRDLDDLPEVMADLICECLSAE